MSEQATPTKTISDFEAKLNEADKSVASFETDDKTLVSRIRAFLRANPTAIPAIILVFSLLAFGLIAKNFMSASTLALILKQVTVVGIVAIAQTIIILTAGIDLSVGIILVLSTMIMGNLAVKAGWPTGIAIPIGILFGTLMGCINGMLITLARIPPFIATLGTWYVYRATNLWYTGSESIRPIDLEQKTPPLLWFGKGVNIVKDQDNNYGFTISGFGDIMRFGTDAEKPAIVAQFIWGGIAMIVLATIVWYMLSRTAWGRHVHAIGDDPDSAMLSGIQVNKTLISVYALAGLICGFGAWVAIGRVGSATPLAFETINLDSITAVVIGGTSLFGGRASIAGSVLGAIIVGVFNTGLSLAGVDSYWQMFASGCLVIVAVAIDQWLRRATQ